MKQDFSSLPDPLFPNPEPKPSITFSHRRGVGFTPGAASFLRSHAKELGISTADLIRRAVDEYRVKCGAVAGVRGRKR